MSLRNKVIALCLLLTGTRVVFANGDPVAVRSALTLSPTPVAVHVPEVQLVDEYATFTPRGIYTDVTVHYLLHNRSSRQFDSLPYGFPIDYWDSGEARWVDHNEMTESIREVGWRDGYIRNVVFMLGDRQLQWQHSPDSIIREPQRFLYTLEMDVEPDSADGYSKHLEDSLYRLYGDGIYLYTYPVSRRWYYTYLNIPAHSFVTLEVRYTIETPLGEGAYCLRKNFYHYTPDYYWQLRFMYDFTPAAYWGDGHADHFTAVLDAREVKILDEKYWSRAFCDMIRGISGLPMKKSGDIWRYEARHFDLAAAKPFTVDYQLKQPPQQPIGKIFSHIVDPSSFTVEVSGADPKYPASNLFDFDPSTATVLRPDGHDSVFITIRFKQPTRLDGMMLINGYTKNADTWRNNSRVDSLLVYKDSYNVAGPFDGLMDTTVYNNELEIGWSGLRGKRPISEKVRSSEPSGYGWQPLLDGAATFRLCDPWWNEYYTSLRIVITSTTKGLKYNDLCISEILLIGR